MGELDGMFVADSEEVAELMGKQVYFGEVLGKHSEIYGTIDDEHEFITKFTELMGFGTIFGFNPLDFLDDELNREEEE